jgi:hypothetical protein
LQTAIDFDFDFILFLLRSAMAGSGSSNSSTTSAAQFLVSVRVISADDNEKTPLWRYMKKVVNTGKGKGGNSKFSCRLYLDAD